MFVNYYKLSEQPFGVTPNPRYLYLTPSHREAMASILYSVMENRGFTALIAPPGMGKTTLLFDLLQRCGEKMRTVFLFQFQPSPEGLLRSLLAELGIPDDGQNFAGMQEKLNQAILQEAKQGRRIVAVVDEAQNFREPVLEVLRMLSNFETSQDKLIHIILSGQPQLAELLTLPSIEQLRQRISIIAMLQPLDAAQTREYIEHRLHVAGYKSARPLFNGQAYRMIAEYSGGIPRTINNLCFNSLSLGCALRHSTIGPDIVSEVYRDLDLEPAPLKANDAALWVRPSVAESALPYSSRPSAGKGLRLAAGLTSLLAALCVGWVFANQYWRSSGTNSAAPSEPQHSVVQAAPTSSAATDTTVNSEQAALAAPTGSEPTATSEESTKEEAKNDETAKGQTTKDSEATSKEVTGHDVPVPRGTAVAVKLVTVSQPGTLYGLCVEHLDDCNARTLQQIREMNPWLHDPKQLHTGQKVRMPLEGSMRSAAKSRKNSQARANYGEKR